MTNEEYFKRYNGIKSLLISAFIDALLLDVLDKYKNDKFSSYTKYPIIHINNLIKTDLALSVWKLWLDYDKRANTFQNLNRFLRDDLGFNNTNIKKPVELKNKAVENDIINARKTLLAHNDWNVAEFSIKTSDLASIVNYSIDTLNSLCFTDIDGRVGMINKSSLISIQAKETIGLATMLDHITEVN